MVLELDIWKARRSNQSILNEINTEYSFEAEAITSGWCPKFSFTSERNFRPWFLEGGHEFECNLTRWKLFMYLFVTILIQEGSQVAQW